MVCRCRSWRARRRRSGAAQPHVGDVARDGGLRHEAELRAPRRALGLDDLSRTISRMASPPVEALLHLVAFLAVIPLYTQGAATMRNSAFTTKCILARFHTRFSQIFEFLNILCEKYAFFVHQPPRRTRAGFQAYAHAAEKPRTARYAVEHALPTTGTRAAAATLPQAADGRSAASVMGSSRSTISARLVEIATPAVAQGPQHPAIAGTIHQRQGQRS